MGNEVPTTSTVAVVVEPRAEDDVSGGQKEDTDHMLVAVPKPQSDVMSLHDHEPSEEAPAAALRRRRRSSLSTLTSILRLPVET